MVGRPIRWLMHRSWPLRAVGPIGVARVPARVNLGLAYLNGQGVSKDHATAASWFRKAAGQGLADATFGGWFLRGPFLTMAHRGRSFPAI